MTKQEKIQVIAKIIEGNPQVGFTSFMNVGGALREAGFKCEFIISDMPIPFHYMVDNDIMIAHVDDVDVDDSVTVVGNVAIG